MNSNHIIIAAFVILFLCAASFLVVREQHLRQPSGWWAVAFSAPHDPMRGFFIENHTTDPLFRYVISTESSLIEEREIIVTSMLTVDIPSSAMENRNDTPLTVTVTHGNEKKTIYAYDRQR